jgi:hypothetical protein
MRKGSLLDMVQQPLAEFSQHLVGSKPVMVSGVAASGAAVTPTEYLNAVFAPVTGKYLATHGVGVLSFTEIIQIAGAIWVVCLVVGTISKGVMRFIGGRNG